ncbi:MAG: bifunctional ADP-dependent NAD(P)H-hydrate dehydratase/NAD(P)H-hydrate epimerase, partial [Alphaproteobacteria bacterium]
VLAGMVAGLMSEGASAFDAAAAAVWLHGATAARLGRGMIASDLIDALPQTLQTLERDRLTHS